MMTTKERKITMSEIKDYAYRFLRDNYNMRSNIPIERNNRLKRTLGKVGVGNYGKFKIDLAGKLLDYGTNEIIKDILRHELIHYALYMNNLPYRDGDPYFENELVKHNSHSSDTLQVGKYYKIGCSNCDNTGEVRTYKMIEKLHSYKSTCCEERLIYFGEVIYNGEGEVHVKAMTG